MKNRTQLNLGKVFYVCLIYHIQDFWLKLLNGYDYFQKHNNAFQCSEHVSMFQTSSSAIMNICKDLQKWSVYITTHIQ